jgi:hypothetical protein
MAEPVFIELLWFDGCPSHDGAHAMIESVIAELDVEARIESIEVTDETMGRAVDFAGSPSIRVAGRDIDPAGGPNEDFSLRCRVYATPTGLQGLPPRQWLVDAISVAKTEDAISVAKTEDAIGVATRDATS